MHPNQPAIRMPFGLDLFVFQSADLLAKEQERQLKEILEGLEDDEFLAQYRQRRLAEMQGNVESLYVKQLSLDLYL